jgi:hypothetical protein
LELVEVLKYGADERLLDTYEVERLPFAKALVATTDRAFEMVVQQTPFARFVRTRLLPLALPLVFRLGLVKRRAFKTVSQTGIAYLDSPLSVGRGWPFEQGGRVPPEIAGDGLRWRLVTPFYSHEKVLAWCAQWNVDLVPWGPKAPTGLVRPDGYAGYVLPGNFDAEALDRYFLEVVGRPIPEDSR